METKRKSQNKPFADTSVEKLVSYCPFCQTAFSPEKATVVGESKESWLLHVICDHCTSSIVLLLLMGEVGISSFGLVTDLTERDVMRFKRSQVVSADDLVSLHQLLNGNQKEFISLV